MKPQIKRNKVSRGLLTKTSSSDVSAKKVLRDLNKAAYINITK